MQSVGVCANVLHISLTPPNALCGLWKVWRSYPRYLKFGLDQLLPENVRLSTVRVPVCVLPIGGVDASWRLPAIRKSSSVPWRRHARTGEQGSL
ncbi:hypothetical protein ACLK1S_16860 [Escherichia coli]